MATFDMRQDAQAGARARLVELLAEADRIRRAFPGIEKDLASGARGGSVARQGVAAPRGRRSTMTAAERKAVSARMKAYWAARREAKASGPTETTEPADAAPNATAKRAKRKGGRNKR